MIESSSAFRAKQSEFSTLVMNELELTAFTFFPSEVFEEFDLYDALKEPGQEKYGFNNDSVKKLRFAAADRKNQLVSADIPQKNMAAWGFDTEGEIFAGFFCLEGLNPKFEPGAQLICEILTEKYRGLYSLLSLRRENYITKFENEINDIVNANIIEGVIITDARFSVMYINPVAATMFGFNSSQVVGHKLEDLLVTSDGIQGLVDRDDKDGQVSSIQYLHRRSGKIFPCQIKVCKMESGLDTFIEQ